MEVTLDNAVDNSSVAGDAILKILEDML